MRDRQFKDKCSKIANKSSNKRYFNADFEVEINGTLLVIEYENSSRGLVHNMVKILKKYEECNYDMPVLPILISTNTHRNKHKADIERSKYLAYKFSDILRFMYFDDEDSFFNFFQGLFNGDFERTINY